MSDRHDEISRWLQARPFQDNPRRLQAPPADTAEAWKEWVKAGKVIPDVDSGLIHMLTQEKDPVMRSAAALALSFVGGESSGAALIRTLQTDVPMVAMEAAASLGRLGDREAVEPLCEALKSPDSNVRANACTALGSVGGEKAFSCLKLAKEDQDAFVRSAAEEALGRMRPG